MVGRFVDLGMTDDEIIDMHTPIPVSSKPTYPPGCRICLCDAELNKLEEAGCDLSDCRVGEILDVRFLGRVTSVSQSDGPDGPCRRIEVQAEELFVESEDEEELGEDY